MVGRCGRCGQARPLRCRGLCAPCYSFLWAHHRDELDRYPLRPPRAPASVAPARPQGRLAPATIRAIRRDTRRQAMIAADHGIAQTTVSAIKRRVLYRHIPDRPADGRPGLGADAGP